VYCRYQIPEEWPYEEARRLFKEPNVTLDIPELKWTAPDEEVCLLAFIQSSNSIVDEFHHFCSFFKDS
jgi:flap endonuclease-1